FEGGEGQLAAAECALEMILAHLADRLFLAYDQSSLRTAKNFVAAESDDVRAGLNTLGDNWFFRQAVFAHVDQCAAAQIFHYWDLVLLTNCDHLFERYFGSEADHFVVTGMNFQ